jgi:hypothetical protein
MPVLKSEMTCFKLDVLGCETLLVGISMCFGIR